MITYCIVSSERLVLLLHAWQAVTDTHVVSLIVICSVPGPINLSTSIMTAGH